MTFARTRTAVAVTMTFIGVLAVPAQALAQDSPSGEPTFKPTPSSAPAAADQSNRLLGPIERLPESAYPSRPLRGIHGGSLWMTFHGQQWPYYPKTGIGVSGYGWIDTGYEHLALGNPTEKGVRYLLQQGRIVLRVTPTWSDGEWFVQGQAELVANKDQSQAQPLVANVDDVWLKVGRWHTFDVQIGRYEAWEIYHFGLGMDQHTLEFDGAVDPNGNNTPAVYGVTNAFYRPPNIGEAALHLYPTDYLRFELGTQFGDENNFNGLAVRPVGILDLGWMKFKAGGEYKKTTPVTEGGKEEQEFKGYGAALQFVVDPYFELGLNGARGFSAHTSNTGAHDQHGSYSTYSLGAFANARVAGDLIVGAGVHYTFLQDEQFDPRLARFEDFDHWQGFAAIQYVLWKQLYIKGVFGYALANINQNNMNPVWNNEMLSSRLRVMFLF